MDGGVSIHPQGGRCIGHWRRSLLMFLASWLMARRVRAMHHGPDGTITLGAGRDRAGQPALPH
ncbi:MAG: hypothetical protein MZV64_17575 [Ignavibacteriales bacterium]|nr:hypothetical protein [Ignavibacteriales bacterium]